MTTRIPHWITGERHDVADRRLGTVYDPATGEQSGAVVLAEPADVDAAVGAATTAFPAWRDTSIARRQADPVPVPRAAGAAQARAGRNHHRRARQGRLRCAGRDRPRPGGARVRPRLRRHPEGRLLDQRLDGRGRLLVPSAASASRRSSVPSTSRPWCRCGSSRSPWHPATRSCSSRARKTRRRRSGWPSC